MPSEHYALEKLSVAVYSLATDPRTLPSRLEDAYLSFMTLGMEGQPDLRPELQVHFDDIMRRLTSVKAVGDEGSVRATLAQMSTAEGIAIATAIYNLAAELGDLLRDVD